jgi:hypothetical protein
MTHFTTPTAVGARLLLAVTDKVLAFKGPGG